MKEKRKPTNQLINNICIYLFSFFFSWCIVCTVTHNHSIEKSLWDVILRKMTNECINCHMTIKSVHYRFSIETNLLRWNRLTDRWWCFVSPASLITTFSFFFFDYNFFFFTLHLSCGWERIVFVQSYNSECKVSRRPYMGLCGYRFPVAPTSIVYKLND